MLEMRKGNYWDNCYSSGTVSYKVIPMSLFNDEQTEFLHKIADEERKRKKKLREEAVAIGFGLLAGFQM